MRISDWSSDVCSADLAAFARAIERDATVRPLSALLVAGAAIACLAVVLLPMRRPTGDVDVAIQLEPTGEGTAFVTATLSPPDAADDAYWFQARAWQGGGLELGEMEPTGEPGKFRSDQAMHVAGLWTKDRKSTRLNSRHKCETGKTV